MRIRIPNTGYHYTGKGLQFRWNLSGSLCCIREKLYESVDEAWIDMVTCLVQALELLDKVLLQASNCIRLKMTRGDCLAHLGR